MQLIFLLLAFVVCSRGSQDTDNIKVLRRHWPRQKGTMVRILKRSAIPENFMEPSENYNPFAEEYQSYGEELANQNRAPMHHLYIPRRLIKSDLLFRSSRSSPSGNNLRSSRAPEAEHIPTSLRNGMLLRSFKRGHGLFLRSSRSSNKRPDGLFLRSSKSLDDETKGANGLFLRSF